MPTQQNQKETHITPDTMGRLAAVLRIVKIVLDIALLALLIVGKIGT